VPRRSQKYFKPEFFSFLQKEKDAWDSVRTTKDWITENEAKEVRISPMMVIYAPFLTSFSFLLGITDRRLWVASRRME